MLSQFESEVKKLYGKSAKEREDYLVYLESQMKIVEEADHHLTEFPFEHLTDSRADLYRIKSKSKRKNVRSIYYYRVDDSIIMLCAFEEKSRSDYLNSINIAIQRIKEIERTMPL